MALNCIEVQLIYQILTKTIILKTFSILKYFSVLVGNAMFVCVRVNKEEFYKWNERIKNMVVYNCIHK